MTTRNWKSQATNLEGPVLHVGLDGGVGELATDQTLGVEDGVGRVHGDLVLGSITDQAFGVGERDVGRRRSVALGRKEEPSSAIISLRWEEKP